jgi:N-acetylmuramoyl-L-alanine amidase
VASGTAAAVRLFQADHGLRADGVCETATWAALVEAGRTLGERLLYYGGRRMLRGEDVASLQRQLSALGFDAGRVDGIFGPETHAALCEFQRNVGLPDDGICGPATVQLLRRYAAKVTGQVMVEELRERLRLSDAPRTLRGWRVAVGEPGGLASLCEAVRRALVRAGADTLTLHDPDESAQASQANTAGVHAYVGLRLDPGLDGCRTSFFLGHNGFYSEAGRHLALLLHETVSEHLGIPCAGCRGTRTPILRQTRMPAAAVEVGPPAVAVVRAPELAAAVTRAMATWVASPLPGGLA